MQLTANNHYVDPESGAVFINRTEQDNILELQNKIDTLTERVSTLENMVDELKGIVLCLTSINGMTETLQET